jgi:hypothetical protein
MIRTICKWFISRSIDQKAPLPHWVRKCIDRDHELRHFESRARQVGSRLRRDAPAWSAIQAVEISDNERASRQLASAQASHSLVRRRIGWSLAGGALAAGVVIALIKLLDGGDQVYRPNPSGDGQSVAISHDQSSSALDRQWLITAWNTGRTTFHQLKARSVNLRSRIEVPDMPDFSTIREPAIIAGSIAGRAAATIDSGIQSQRRQFTSDLQSAFAFFTHRLPATAAKLLGLHS